MNINESTLLSVGTAAQYLGLTPTTLRRWHKAGSFRATFVSPGQRLYYSKADLEKKTRGLAKSAFAWASATESFEPPAEWYCPTSDIFKARLERMDRDLVVRPGKAPVASLLASAAGEIGNNSYDHNLGNWPDLPGTFFAYDLGKRLIVLADRGVGILKTLQQVKPNLATHKEAVTIAFTQVITGRAPEHRGNGLKFVRNALGQASAKLTFQSGTAQLILANNSRNITISSVEESIRGCLAIIHF